MPAASRLRVCVAMISLHAKGLSERKRECGGQQHDLHTCGDRRRDRQPHRARPAAEQSARLSAEVHAHRDHAKPSRRGAIAQGVVTRAPAREGRRSAHTPIA